MNKLKEIMDKYNLTEAQVTRFTGQPSRSTTLQLVANGKRDIMNVNLSQLTGYARGLGLRLEDVLNDFELDGSSAQVDNITRYVDKLERLNNHVKTFENNGFIVSSGIDKQNYILKKNYEFLNPESSHGLQPTNDIYLLNNQYLNVLRDKKTDRNKTIAKLTPRMAGRVKSVVIYSPLSAGGDLRIVAESYGKYGNYCFTEIYGAEWINQDDNKTICYYKAHNDKRIDPKDINRIKKQEISELEFYKAFNPQLPQYNVIQ